MLRRVFADRLLLGAVPRLNQRRIWQARMQIALSVRIAPPNGTYLYAAAFAAERAGDRDGAVEYCEKALEVIPELGEAHRLLGGMFLHGEDYLQVLERIQRHLAPRTYVEVGVDTGRSLRLVQPGTAALGIDPEPKIPVSLPAGLPLFAQKSDDFLARRNIHAELRGRAVDLAFIDGMHHFEY